MLTLSITMYFVQEISQSQAFSEATWVSLLSSSLATTCGETPSQAVKSTIRVTSYIYIYLVVRNLPLDFLCDITHKNVVLWVCYVKQGGVAEFPSLFISPYVTLQMSAWKTATERLRLSFFSFFFRIRATGPSVVFDCRWRSFFSF